jgi:hypothetical protein
MKRERNARLETFFTDIPPLCNWYLDYGNYNCSMQACESKKRSRA